MATWHQQQAQKRTVLDLRSPTEYTVVINPPLALQTCVRFRLKREAMKYRKNYSKIHKVDLVYIYILDPSGKKPKIGKY